MKPYGIIFPIYKSNEKLFLSQKLLLFLRIMSMKIRVKSKGLYVCNYLSVIMGQTNTNLNGMYKQNVPMSYGKNDYIVNRASNSILELVIEQYDHNPSIFGDEQQVAELTGLPKLGGENDYLGKIFLEDLQEVLVRNGVAKGLDVVVSFITEYGRKTNGEEDKRYDTKQFKFRLFYGNCENSYGPDFQRPTYSYQDSVGRVYLKVVDKPKMVESPTVEPKDVVLTEKDNLLAKFREFLFGI